MPPSASASRPPSPPTRPGKGKPWPYYYGIQPTGRYPDQPFIREWQYDGATTGLLINGLKPVPQPEPPPPPRITPNISASAAHHAEYLCADRAGLRPELLSPSRRLSSLCRGVKRLSPPPISAAPPAAETRPPAHLPLGR